MLKERSRVPIPLTGSAVRGRQWWLVADSWEQPLHVQRPYGTKGTPRRQEPRKSVENGVSDVTYNLRMERLQKGVDPHDRGAFELTGNILKFIIQIPALQAGILHAEGGIRC